MISKSFQIYQGYPTTVSCKITVRRSEYCLEFSIPWRTRPRSHLGVRSISDRSGLYTSWMWTFALSWDRSGIASGGGLRSVQDRSTLFRAKWERKHALKAIQLSSLPSLRVPPANRTWGVLVLQVAKKSLQKRRTVETRALIAAWDKRRIHDKIDKSHRNADVYADIAKAVKKQGLSWTWLEAEWVLKKVHETSKSCDYQTRIFVSFSQLSGHKSTAMKKNFLEFLELSF